MSALRAEVSAAIRAGNAALLRDLLSRCTATRGSAASSVASLSPSGSPTASATSTSLPLLDLNAPSLTGDPSLLSEAVAALRLPVVRLLLQAGAHPNGVTGEVAAPMTIAALQGRLDIVQQLISAGGCAEINDGAPLYAICAGTSGSAVAGAKLLLNTGADCNRHPPRCAPPLIVAVNRSKVALVRVLLKAGADPNRQSPVVGKAGERALHVAVRNGSVAMVKLLLKYGAEPSLPDGEGVTPLQLAVRMQRDSIRAVLATYAGGAAPAPRGSETRRPPSRKFFIGRSFLAIPWRK